MLTVETVLTKSQVKQFRAETPDSVIVAEVRYDDECGNGHNTFAITAEIYEPHPQRGEPTTKHSNGRTMWLNACGCCHEEVAKHFPQLAPLLKWHLTSSDGPMHYVANTVYQAGDRRTGEDKERDLAAARSCAVWPDATDEDLTAPGLEERLLARLPALLAEFKAAVESLGFTY